MLHSRDLQRRLITILGEGREHLASSLMEETAVPEEIRSQSDERVGRHRAGEPFRERRQPVAHFTRLLAAENLDPGVINHEPAYRPPSPTRVKGAQKIGWA